MDTLLQYHHVSVCISSTPVVQDISFILNPGEILGIVGESGCGKSTLLKSAMGLFQQPDTMVTGEILLHGKNLLTLSSKEMRTLCGTQIGMVFQDFSATLCPIRTIGSQIYESIKAHRPISKTQAKAQAIALFETLNLPNPARIWTAYPFELSGGMNQRVNTALAMIMKPPVLLADEPTSALDLTAQKQLLEQLLLLRAQYGTAIVLVTHDIGVISALADTVLVLQHGRAVEYGKKDTVLHHPQHAYTKALLAAMPKLRRH